MATQQRKIRKPEARNYAGGASSPQYMAAWTLWSEACAEAGVPAEGAQTEVANPSYSPEPSSSSSYSYESGGGSGSSSSYDSGGSSYGE